LSFVTKILNFISDNHLVSSEDNILVAVSGGVDSCVMMHVLNILKNDLNLHIGAAHFNHKLRGSESDRDEEFVRKTVENIGIDFHRGEWINKEEDSDSLQMRAHRARFDFLDSICEIHGYNKIALGHNYDDNVETILIALLGGYGLKGLSGIQPLSGNRIHPLLAVTRNEIQDYAVGNGVHWVEDSSNIENKYLRNRIRNLVIPGIREHYPDFDKGIIQIASEASEFNREIEQDVENIWRTGAVRGQNSEVILEINAFLQYFSMLRKYLIIDIFKKLPAGRRPSPGILKEIVNLCRSETGSMVFFSDIRILKDRNRLIFSNHTENEVWQTLSIGQSNQVGEYEIILEPVNCQEVQYNSDPTVEYIDLDRLSGSLTVRNWREGDKFRPLGMTGEIKISDFFTNNKLSMFEKNKILIIHDEEKIVWVCGMRLDDRVTIVDKTTNCLKMIIRSFDKPIITGD